MFALSWLFVLSSLFFFNGVRSAPSCALQARDQPNGLAKRAIPSTRFVVYGDEFVSGLTGPPPVSEIQGFNVFVLSFLLISGPADKALEWSVQLSASQRASIKAEYEAAGVSLMVSAFGSTDAPTSTNADPVGTAQTMAAFVKQFTLDGIDVDYEDFNAINAGDGKAEAWIASFTQEIRTLLPKGQFILSHAPVAPWFTVNSQFAAGAYLTVDKTVGSLIDWYNVQFYNQGTNMYTTCDGLLNTAGSVFPKSALFEIAAAGISLNKLVIGKPGAAGDASNGFIAPATLAGCVEQAKAKGWSAGVMSWEFPHANAAWIETVRSQAFPE